MKKVAGWICIFAGLFLLISAGIMLLSGRHQSTEAEKQIEILVHSMYEQMDADVLSEENELVLNQNMDENDEMPSKKIGDYYYIGYLKIPVLGRELPVLESCNEYNLKAAPCRFSGTIQTNDLVIAGHNYRSHFGGLSRLYAGEQFSFVDIKGRTYEYVVVSTEVLEADQVREMTEGKYDLTLFTCTAGGRSRLAIRCNQLNK